MFTHCSISHADFRFGNCEQNHRLAHQPSYLGHPSTITLPVVSSIWAENIQLQIDYETLQINIICLPCFQFHLRGVLGEGTKDLMVLIVVASDLCKQTPRCP